MKISYKIQIIAKRGRPKQENLHLYCRPTFKKENKLIKPHSPRAIVVNRTTAPNLHFMISY